MGCWVLQRIQSYASEHGTTSRGSSSNSDQTTSFSGPFFKLRRMTIILAFWDVFYSTFTFSHTATICGYGIPRKRRFISITGDFCAVYSNRVAPIISFEDVKAVQDHRKSLPMTVYEVVVRELYRNSRAFVRNSPQKLNSPST